jgi:UDP-N-acetylmuramate dehydrogenase
VVRADNGLHALVDALGERATADKPLGPLTTYGVGGAAAVYVEIEGPEDLAAVRRALARHAASVAPLPPVFVLGRGSNLLVADEGFDGIVLHLGAGFAAIELPPPVRTAAGGSPPPAAAPVVVRAGAAAALPVLARRVADAGWSGLSWAVGVPGSVGGAVRMNAGGHGSDMASCLVRYDWIDLGSDEEGSDGVARLRYGYRTSSVTPSQVVVAAELAISPGSVQEEQAAVGAIVKWRREHQPGGANAGSVFTNPAGDSAGRLIEAAGLKGFRLGTAHVSEKHANFIQAEKHGRAGDVRALMTHVRGVVAEQHGVELQAEVRLLGFRDGKNGEVDANSGGSGAPQDGAAS